ISAVRPGSAAAGNFSKCIFERLVNDSNVSQPRKILLLVDGSSYLYRAFHALPDLRNSAGEPTNAIKGVLSMLHKLRKDHAADYIACVFDAKGKTFRDELYPAYKEHRPPMPDDLRSQIEPLHEAMRAETLDEAGVAAKFGVPPERIIDYLTLVGDAVDNVPGVAKCGPKTAVKWLTEYGTLDNLMAHADEIKSVVGDNLRAALARL